MLNCLECKRVLRSEHAAGMCDACAKNVARIVEREAQPLLVRVRRIENWIDKHEVSWHEHGQFGPRYPTLGPPKKKEQNNVKP